MVILMDDNLHFNPRAQSMEIEDDDAFKKGYKFEDYFWFGTSIPEHLFYECTECNARYKIHQNKILSTPIPKICEECHEKNKIKIYDERFWMYYKTLRLWEYDLFLDQFDDFFAAQTGADGIRRIFAIRSEQHKSRLSLILKNKAAIEQALLFMEGLALRSGQRKNLNVRVAEGQNKSIWIDLCDDKWRAICLNSDGWHIVENPPILFKRYKHMAKMEVDENGAKEDYDAFLTLMNFQAPEDKLLYSGFLIQGFFPNIDRPILMPTGAQGSAKTTMCIATRMVIDPSTLPTFNMNKEEDELPQKILHHYLPTFDNCNHISQEISDLLCQASSGMGFSKRKLFTDMDDVVYSVRRAIIMNGVAAPSMAPDLLDRTIMICLERIPDDRRKERSEIEAMRDSLLPKVRGYLLNILTSALKNPQQRNGTLPRLADFARLADDCMVQMGYSPGEFIRTYRDVNKDIAEQAIQGDVLAGVLLEFLDDNNGWEGSASDLLKRLENKAGIQAIKAPGWAKTQGWLSEAIFGRLKPGLQHLGWNVQKTRTEKRRIIYIKRVDNSIKGWEDDTKMTQHDAT